MLNSQTQDEAGICAQSNEDLDQTLLQNGECKAYDNNMETHPDESNTGKHVQCIFKIFVVD